MSAYRRLLSNTFLFSVSTFGSKILTFLLTPFYTSILSDAEYGVTDLIIQTGNFLIPLASTAGRTKPASLPPGWPPSWRAKGCLSSSTRS